MSTLFYLMTSLCLSSPQAANDIQRNHSSYVVLLYLYATPKSGNIQIDRFAPECGIDILTVSGLVTNPEASRCHNLIASGAQLAVTAAGALNNLMLITKLVPCSKLLGVMHQLVVIPSV